MVQAVLHTLQVDDNTEHQNGRQQIHNIGEVLTIERLSQRQLLVGPSPEQVHSCNDGTLKLRTTASVNCRRRECTPNNGLADVRRDKQADATAQSIALLQQFVEEDDNQRRGQQLHNQEHADTSTKVAGWSVEASEHVDASVGEGEDDCKKLLRSLVQFAIGLEVEVDIDKVSASK